MPTAGFTRRAAARLGYACGVSALGYISWREFYLRVLRPKRLEERDLKGTGSSSYYHALRLTTSYYMGVPAEKGFLLLADPTLLNQTTPSWFCINVRPKSKDTMRHFCHYLKNVDFDMLDKFDQKDLLPQIQAGTPDYPSLTGQSQAHFAEMEEAKLSNEQEFLRSFPYFFSYWVLFLGLPFPWTSKVLICQKVLNPQHHQSSVSLADVQANVVNVELADQCLVKESLGHAPGDALELDENVVVRPLLGPETYKYFFRMKYAVETGPYLRFEHTHLVICEKDGPRVNAERGGPEMLQERCRVEDTIVFTVLGEPILDYMTSFFLKRILLCRFTNMIADHGGAYIDEQVFDT